MPLHSTGKIDWYWAPVSGLKLFPVLPFHKGIQHCVIGCHCCASECICKVETFSTSPWCGFRVFEPWQPAPAYWGSIHNDGHPASSAVLKSLNMRYEERDHSLYDDTFVGCRILRFTVKFYKISGNVGLTHQSTFFLTEEGIHQRLLVWKLAQYQFISTLTYSHPC